MPYLTSSSLPIFLSHIFILSSHLSSHLQSSPWSQFILQQRNTEFEGKRDWRRRRVDSWLAGTFAVYIRSKDTWWRQGTLVQSNLRMAKSAKSKSTCVHVEHVHVYIYTSAFPIVCVRNKFVIVFTFMILFFISTFITWPGNCLVEQWPSVSCCPCWRPRPCHWPEPHSQSWPQPHEVRRSCGRRTGVGWRNPLTGKPGRSGRQAHKLGHWSLGHIW